MEFDLISALIGAFLGFICAYFAKEAFLERKIRRLEEENEDLDDSVKSLQNTLNGREGINAKRDKTERMQALMIELAAAMQTPGAAPADVIKQMAAKYPDIAMDLIKKGMKLT